MNALFPAEGRALDLVPVGRVAVDLNPTDYNRPLSQSQHFNKYLGGSPANIAVGAARLGLRVGFLGKISNDAMGDFVADFFRREGIDLSHLTRAKNGESLGLTFTEILSPTQSSILMYREGVADLALDPGDVDEAYVASTRALLVSGTALSASPSREACFKALAYARRHETCVIFDADYRAYTWKSKDEVAVYTSLAARQSDILLGSREEFDLMERLLGLPGTDEASADYWLSRGAKLLAIKHGKEGSYAYAPGERYRVRPFPVEALKGFGGGDGYASAFLAGLMGGLPLPQALEMGSASAAMLVASHACSRDMPTRAALDAFIAEKKAVHGGVVSAL